MILEGTYHVLNGYTFVFAGNLESDKLSCTDKSFQNNCVNDTSDPKSMKAFRLLQKNSLSGIKFEDGVSSVDQNAANIIKNTLACITL